MYDSVVKTLGACLGIVVPVMVLSQVPPAETPRYPAGAEPPKALPAGPKNLDFHEGTEGGLPAGWFVPRALLLAGYGAELSKTGCKTEACAVVTTPPRGGTQFGNLMQTFDAAAYLGKTIHLHAALRLEASSSGDTAQMWLRVDCDQNRVCGLDNMGDRPVRSAKWKNADISVRVPLEAVKINIGLVSLGHGRAWMDEVTLTVPNKK
jgi:hypothetical protein